MDSSERRKHPRAAFDGWVEIHLDGGRRLGTGFDLSAGGIGFVLELGVLPQLVTVACEFALPGIYLPLELSGGVAWRNGSRNGVRFEEVDPGLAELLENYVAGRL